MAIEYKKQIFLNTSWGKMSVPYFEMLSSDNGSRFDIYTNNFILECSVLNSGYYTYGSRTTPTTQFRPTGDIELYGPNDDTNTYKWSPFSTYNMQSMLNDVQLNTWGPGNTYGFNVIIAVHVTDTDQYILLYNTVYWDSALRYNYLDITSTQPSEGSFGYAIISANRANIFYPQFTIYDDTSRQAFDRGVITGAVPLDSDPYAPGGNSGTGGGTGTFDLTSDAIDFPALPTLTAVSTGLVSIYTPSLTQLNSLANYLWNADPTTVDWWKKLVANPLDLILGLSIVPVSVPAGAAQNVKVGLIDTGVSMTKAASQFVTVDCGTLNVAEFWGSALDYSPFTKFSIYLPFIGTRTISTDDIMGKAVHVKYNIDLLSGACTAMVKCGNAVLYQYSGACSISLPLSGETFTNMITSTIQLAAGIAGTVASGGAAAGITAASAANSVMSMKPTIERAGGVSGAAGQLGVMQPYLIGEIPRQSVPKKYNTFAGYPSNITATIGDLSGYTEVETIYIQGLTATKTELDEIERLLKEGVII